MTSPRLLLCSKPCLRRPDGRFVAGLVCSAMLAAPLMLGGCGGSPGATDSQSVRAGDEKAGEALAASTQRMQSVMDKMTPEERDDLRASMLMQPRARRPKPVDLPPVETASASTATASPAGGTTQLPPGYVPPEGGAGAPRGAGGHLASDFGKAVRPQGVSASLLDAMQLAAQSASDPAAARQLSALEATLAPADRAVLVAFRSMLTAAGDPATKTEADWAKLLADHAAALNASGTSGVSIGRTMLCRRVEAFGRYIPLETSGLVAGRPIVALVYVELDNFGYKPTSKAWLDGPVPSAESAVDWEVQIAQEIEVLTSSGVSILRIPESVARDVSRNKRRELYLVQRIELPPTLAAGRYTLKTRVRDMATSAEAESIMEFTLFADGVTAAIGGR